MKLVINTIVALTHLYENRDKHIKEYKAQLEGWKNEHEKYAESLKKWGQESGIDKERPNAPFKPKSYLKYYDSYIKKLSFHQLENIEVEEYEFDMIINDKWNWQRQFLTTSSVYNSNGSLYNLQSNDDDEI